MIVEALWRATKVEGIKSPYDTIHLKVLYPGTVSAPQQLFPPYPVVIFFSGVGCSLAIYEWLALKLVERGVVVVLLDWVAENIPGSISLTPGVNLTAFLPDVYGTVPSALALPSLLAELEDLQSKGRLAGMLDLQKIILGGHSAGGRIALENAEPKFFNGVVAAFSYGGHSAAPIQLGYEPGTILSLPSSLPMLLMGGTQDGVIAQNSKNYGISSWETAATPVVRTFREAIASARDDTYLVILEGANHFAIATPLDPTLQVTALDFPNTQSEAQIRSMMARIIGLFVDIYVCQKIEAKEKFKQLLATDNSLIAFYESK